MAELPKYKSTGRTFGDMPQLTTAPFQEAMRSSQRVQQFLTKAQEYAQAEAIEYATDEAIDYAIRNPITKEQIDQARNTGGNPVTEYLTGGRVYNDAIKKTLGQQIAGELDLELQKHQNDVLEKVRLGEITNSDDMLRHLKKPIQGQVEFFSQVDPELAQAYAANATITARNKYIQGDAIFKDLKEQDAKIKALQSIDNALVKYSDYLEANPDATLAMRQEFINAVTAVTTDNSLSMSREQKALVAGLKDKLMLQEDNYVAQQLAKKYAGQEINDVLEAIKTDPTANAEYFRGKSQTDEAALTGKLKTYLTIENAGSSARSQQVAIDIDAARMYVNDGVSIPADLAKRINDNIKVDTAQYNQWKILQNVAADIKVFRVTPLNDLNERLINLNNKIQSNQASLEELYTKDVLAGYIDKLQKGLASDEVQTTLSRAGVYEALDFSDPRKLKTQMVQRSLDMNKYGKLYNLSKPKLLSKQDIMNYNKAFLVANTEDRSLLIQAVAEASGENAYQVFNQLSEDNPVIAHFGQLSLRDIDDTTKSLLENGIEASKQFTPSVPNATDLFAAEFGTAYDRHPGMMTNIIESANRIYLGLLQKEGKPLAAYDKSAETAQFDKGLYEKALELASGAKEVNGVMYGGVVDYNGQKISLPSSIARDEFDSKMRAATTDDVILSMSMKIDANTYIPLFTKIDNKYYLNTYDPATGRERVTDQVVDKPLLEMKQADITQREFDIDRIKDANLEMDSDKHAFINIDGAYFVPDFDPTYKIMINVESIYRRSQPVRGVGGFDPAIQEKQMKRAEFERQERARIQQLPKDLQAPELRKLKSRLDKEF